MKQNQDISSSAMQFVGNFGSSTISHVARHGMYTVLTDYENHLEGQGWTRPEVKPEFLKVDHTTRYHPGDRFIHKAGEGDTGEFMLVTASHKVPAGFACMVSVVTGRSYTGEITPIKSSHEISQEEFSVMVGGHTAWFKPIRLFLTETEGGG